MATVRKRGEYQWQAIVKRKGFPSQSKTFETRKDAEDWATVIESEMVRGVFVSRTTAERTTLQELIDQYEREVTPTKRGADREKYRLNILRRSRLAPMFMAAIRSQDVAAFRDARVKEGIAANTIKNDLNTLSAIFEHARREWSIHVPNPVRDVKRPKAPTGRDRRLSALEERLLLAACDKSRCRHLGASVRLAIETATRLSELSSLDWRDVDLVKRTAKVRGKDGRETKNEDAYRVIPLSTAAIAALKAQEGPVKHISGKVLPGSSVTLQHAFKAAVARARKEYEAECQAGGVEPAPDVLVDVRWHDLRHEGTSRLFEKGLNPMEAASVTGHKTLAMLKRYTHLKAEDLARKLG